MNEQQPLKEKIAKSWGQYGARSSSRTDAFTMYLWSLVGVGSIIFLIKEYLTRKNSSMILMLWVLLGLSVVRVLLAFLSKRMTKSDIQPKDEDKK